MMPVFREQGTTERVIVPRIVLSSEEQPLAHVLQDLECVVYVSTLKIFKLLSMTF